MKKIFLFLNFIFFAGFLFAQKQVTVQVRDAKTGTPLSNASVKIKSTNRGTTTNTQGVSTIQAGDNDVL